MGAVMVAADATVAAIIAARAPGSRGSVVMRAARVSAIAAPVVDTVHAVAAVLARAAHPGSVRAPDRLASTN